MSKNAEQGLTGCPFCGQDDELTIDEDNQGMWRVTCHICKISGPYGYARHEAKNRWNARQTANTFIAARDIIKSEESSE
jgi:Lar family restriction alleviation protein